MTTNDVTTANSYETLHNGKDTGVEPSWEEIWGDTPQYDEGSKPGAEGALCHLCPLYDRPIVHTKMPDVEFNGEMLVGEAPGSTEVVKKQPFVGPSGRLLREVYDKAKGNLDATIRTNAVLCRPPDDRDPLRPTQQEMDCCAPRLKREMDEHKPTKILALGKVAVEQLRAITQKHLDLGGWSDNMLACSHPAYVLRQGAFYPTFKRTIERFIRGADPENEILRHPPTVTVIETPQQLRDVCNSIDDGSWVAFDVETNNIHWADRKFGKGEQYGGDCILCLVFTTGYGYGWVVPDYLVYDCDPAKEILNSFFARMRTIAHNSKFDMLFLRKAGLYIHCDVDTILLHFTLDENKGGHGLKVIAANEFDVPDYEGEYIDRYLRSHNDAYSKLPVDKLYVYGVWDVCLTLAVAVRLKGKAIRQKTSRIEGNMWETPFMSLKMPTNRMLTNVEARGVKVDVPYLRLWRERLLARAEHIRKQLAHYARNDDFNPHSTKQMKEMLFNTLGLPLTKGGRIRGLKSAERGGTSNKDGTTGKEGLQQLEGLHPVIPLIKEYRSCRKMQASYIDNLLSNVDNDDRVHTSYLAFGTLTSRLAAREPALQQIPRGGSFYGKIIKAAFISDVGKVLIDADYRQAQLRIFAAETGDPFMLGAFERDEDFHDAVLTSQYGPKHTLNEYEQKQFRFYCKTFNFGWCFGGGVEMLMGLMPNPHEAYRFVQKYEKTMHVAAAWRQVQADHANRHGWVESRMGQRRRGYLGSLIGSEAINAPIQAGENEILCKSAIRLDNEGYDVLLLVHDSLVLEVPENDGDAAAQHIGDVMLEEAQKQFPEVKWGVDVDPPKTRWMSAPTDEQIEKWLEEGTKEVHFEDEGD